MDGRPSRPSIASVTTYLHNPHIDIPRAMRNDMYINRAVTQMDADEPNAGADMKEIRVAYIYCKILS